MLYIILNNRSVLDKNRDETIQDKIFAVKIFKKKIRFKFLKFSILILYFFEYRLVLSLVHNFRYYIIS